MEDKKGKKIMKLNDAFDNVEYILEFSKEDDHIHFKLKESKVYAPFTFENDFTMDEFIERNKAFKSCDDLDEVLRHLYNLYDQKRIELMAPGAKDEEFLYFKLWDISEEIDSEGFLLKKKMTEHKDKALEELYNIQYQQIELLQQIKATLEKNSSKENPLFKAISKALLNCPSKLVVDL